MVTPQTYRVVSKVRYIGFSGQPGLRMHSILMLIILYMWYECLESKVASIQCLQHPFNESHTMFHSHSNAAKDFTAVKVWPTC